VKTNVSEERIASIIRVPLVTANVPSWPILVSKMMEAIRSSETSILTRSTRRDIPEDGIVYSNSRESLKSHITFTGWALRRCNVFPGRYELDLYIPEDGILRSHCRENLKSYIALTGWAL
jgi:hypothetical protein